ncbi:uncharacterized protein LOC122058594 [Macadamia integrifolia]|uniref:uncharacterized protein LOC122058594 n=1 Tax=Macadamia integrifolia TaxID=60698 RepID=UPI001C53143D|nr:uncharacterized protein LOC122058594 [Macadamia integrifolia]
MIKSMCKEHSCGRDDENKNVTSTWIVKHLASQLKAVPDMKTDAMQAYFMDNFCIKVPYQTCYRAKKKAIENNEGSHSKTYAKLLAYGDLIMEKNPGSVFKLQFYERSVMFDPPVFKRFFICFKTCVDGFLNGCRPFIGVDGCHLKGTFGGVLLVVVTVDGNRGLFPFAYGVIETKCKDNWYFFLNQLYTVLHAGICDNPITFMSDKQKGLCDAITNVFPRSQHR